jgi:hypothetical protein
MGFRRARAESGYDLNLDQPSNMLAAPKSGDTRKRSAAWPEPPSPPLRLDLPTIRSRTIRLGRSQARQLPGIHYFVHTLGFFALNVEAMRKLEGLAGVGFGAGPTFNILRKDLVVRAAADGGGARMPMR